MTTYIIYSCVHSPSRRSHPPSSSKQSVCTIIMAALHRRSSVSYPPLDGSLFLPELVEFNAQHNSDVTFFVYDKPDSNDLVSISHLDFYQACHRAAHGIRPGRAGRDKEVIAVIGNSDTLLYQTVFMGIIF